MISKFNWILLLILLGQIVLILVLDNPWSSGHFRDEEMKQASLFPEFNMGEAAIVEIQKQDKKIRLIRKDKQWRLLGGDMEYKADAFSVDTLLSSIKRIRDLDVVSRNMDKAALFGLDGDQVVRLQVFDQNNRSMAGLLVGKNMGPLRGTYIKRMDQDEIYLEPENIRRVCDPGENWIFEWRDNRVFDFAPGDVAGILINNEHGVIELKRSENTQWKMIQPREAVADPVKCEKMTEALASIKLVKNLDSIADLKELGLDPPKASVTLFLKNKEQRKIRFSGLRDNLRNLILDKEPPTLGAVKGFTLSAFLVQYYDLLDKSEVKEAK